MFKKLKGFFGGKGRVSEPAETDLFPYESDAFYDDPYAFYKRLREEAPFYFMADGTCVLSKTVDIRIALDHPSLGNTPSRFSSLHESKSERFVCAHLANNIMPFLDGPKHKEQRRLIAKIFSKEVKRVSDSLDDCGERFVASLSSSFSVIKDLGTPFALEVICDLLNIERDERLQKWSSFFFYLFTKIPSVEVRDEIDENLTEFRNWLRSQMYRDEMPESGISYELRLAVEGGEIDEIVALDCMILLFADGLENVDSGIGNMLYVFSQHPDQWEMLRNDHGLLEKSVDELLRYESPAHYVARTCLEEFTWNGHSIKKDSNVLLLLGSANRDEDEYLDAEVFDISRDAGSLSFGVGKHSCLGTNLVKLELTAVLKAMVKHFKEINLQGDVEWQNRKGHRWLEEAEFRVGK